MTGAGTARERFVRCPTCGQRARYAADNPWRPFCSERCRSVDLGAWADQAYRVPASVVDAEAADPADPASAVQPPDGPAGRPH